MIQIQLHKWAELDVYQRKAVLRRPAVADDMGTREGAAAIVGDVRQNGDEALFRLTREYDQASLTALRVSDDELAQAATALTAEQVDAIDLAIGNVRRFH